MVALLNDCSGYELENGKPGVVFSPSVSTCPSLAAGHERDETVERNPLAKWKSLIMDRKKAGKELRFEMLSPAVGQVMLQLVKETDMELAGESPTEAQTDYDDMYAPSWKQQMSHGGTEP